MSKKIAIIGAGHNGLIAACYLARSGFAVTIFERRGLVGGMCVTEELINGFQLSSLAGWSGMLRPQFIDELDLKNLGLYIYPTENFAYLFHSGGSLIFGKNKKPLINFEQNGTKFLEEWYHHNEMCSKAAAILEPLLTRPNATGKVFENNLRAAGLNDIADLVNQGTLQEFALRTLGDSKAVGAACSEAMNTPPFFPGTLFQRIFLSTAQTNGVKETWGLPRGGMGTITATLSQAAKKLGVQIHLHCPVSKIIINDEQAKGIELENGSRHFFDLLISNADLLSTLTKLIDPICLPQEVIGEITRVQASLKILPAKVHLTFSKAPTFPASGVADAEMMRTSYTFVPDREGLKILENDCLNQRLSEQNILSCIFPSSLDPSCAPPGKHCASLSLYCCPETNNGQAWNEQSKELILQNVLSILRKHSVDLEEKLEKAIVISPTDIAETYGTSTGHCFHWPLDADHLFENRPLQAAPGYQSPIKNLFICGSSAYPGGTVSGLPGYNCAQIIKALHNT